MDDAARRVAHRLGTRLEPAVGAVRSPEAGGQVECPSFVGPSPRPASRLEIILMDHGVPRLELHEVVEGPPEVLRAPPDPVQASTRIVREAGIDVIGLTVGCRAPDHRRQGLDQAVETLFAVAQCLVRPLLVVDVDVHTVPANLSAPGIAYPYARSAKPPVGAVDATHAVLDDIRVAGCDGVRPGRDRVVDVRGMQYPSPCETRHALDAIELLDAFAGVLHKARIHVSQLPVLTGRPGESRHILDDETSFAIAVIWWLVGRSFGGKSHGSPIQVAACPRGQNTKVATPGMRTITENRYGRPRRAP